MDKKLKESVTVTNVSMEDKVEEMVSSYLSYTSQLKLSSQPVASLVTRICIIPNPSEQYFRVKSLVIEIGSRSVDKKVRKIVTKILAAHFDAPVKHVRLTRSLEKGKIRNFVVSTESGQLIDIVPGTVGELNFLLSMMNIQTYVKKLLMILPYRTTQEARSEVRDEKYAGVLSDHVITKTYNLGQEAFSLTRDHYDSE